MNIDYERLRELIAAFPWKNAGAYGKGNIELVWSKDRNPIDAEFYFDDCLRQSGNIVDMTGCGDMSKVLTVDDWLYFASTGYLDNPALKDSVLLYRALWDNVEMIDAKNIRIVGGIDE